MNIKKKILFVSTALFAAALFAQEAEQTEDLGTKITVAREKEETVITDEAENEESAKLETEDINESVTDTDEGDYYDGETIKSNSKEKKKKNKSSFGEKVSEIFTSTNKSFKEYGTTDLFFTSGVNKVKKDESVFVVIDKTDYAGVGVQMVGQFYYVFFDKTARSLLIDAGNQYLKDFEEKNLNRKDRKAIRKYGKVKSKIFFATFKAKAVNNCEPITYYGYDFIKDSPYFSITCLATNNEKFKESDVYPKDSNQIQLNFTKAQLKNLMELLSEENLNNLALQNASVNFIDEY